jgi:long-chain acyl-CoA synthetase
LDEEEAAMEKIWLKSYPAGVPAEIDVNAYRSIPELIDQNVVKYRDRAAYICMGKTITFGDVDRLSERFAAWLQSKNLPKGARVAVMMPNVLQYPIAVFGILRAGLTVVNVNPLYTPR